MNSVGNEAIVLVGGLGSRVNTITGGRIPKPMLAVGGRPFLEHQLDWLAEQGITRLVLAVGFKAEVVIDHFGDNYRGMQLLYSEEGEHLLGTGGALCKAAALLAPKAEVYALNGDTWFPVSLAILLEFHRVKQAAFSMALAEVTPCNRFGTVVLDGQARVTAFHEKQRRKRGMINGGIYCLSAEIWSEMPEGVFSLERDFLQPRVAQLPVYGLDFDANFCDIGTPEDYEAFIHGEQLWG